MACQKRASKHMTIDLHGHRYIPNKFQAAATVALSLLTKQLVNFQVRLCNGQSNRAYPKAYPPTH